MEASPYQEALEAATEHRDLIVAPVTNGLINQTYKVTDPAGSAFLLQQINNEVFAEPETVQENYEKIWAHLYYGESPKNILNPVTIPAPRNFLDGSALFMDRYKKYWRQFEFIDKAQTIDAPVNSFQAKKVAQTFGSLTASFESYDIEMLHITIPDFHDLSLRSKQFQQALRSRDLERLQKSAPLVQELKKRDHYVSFYEVLVSSDQFEKRLMHHDAKISNILFDEETGSVICPVDLDTCMPGHYFSDLGDMIRSMACSEDENSLHFDEIEIRKDFYEAIIEGYLEMMGTEFTEAEKKYIHHTGLLVIYMQALRFLTDHLNGDIYYRTRYPGQNFDRAKNQLTLLQQLELFLSEHYAIKIG